MSRTFFPTYSLNRFGVRDSNQAATLSGWGLGLGDVERFDSEPAVRSANVPTVPMLGRAGLGMYMVPQRPIVAPRIVSPVAAAPPSTNGAPISSSGGGGAVPRPIATPVLTAPVSWQTTPTPVATLPPPTPVQPILVSSGGGVATPPTSTIVATPTPAPAPAATPNSALATTYTTDQYGNIVNAQTGAIVMTAAQAAASGLNATSLNSSAAAGTPSVTVSTGSADLTSQISAWLGGTTTLFNYSVPNALLAGVVVLGFAWLSAGAKKK